jgi:hypothetical protein
MAVANQPALPPGASSEGVGRGQCASVLFNSADRPRKKLITKLNDLFYVFTFNSLTPKSVPAGMKTLAEGFLLAKYKHTNIPTMMEPFAPPAAWFCRSSIPHPREPLRKGLAEVSVEGIW